MPSATNSTVDRVARTFRAITADANGTLPSKIEILKVGMWDTPNHGMFMITPDDCQEMVDNFNAGIGLPGQGLIGAPIDFGHDSDDEAAGWIKGLTFDGMTVYADPVEWTSAGTEALNGGTYKCFSPEFYPGSRGGWEDPEQYDVYVPNVLVGGGLTNIPLFKGLKPIVASQTGGKVSDDDRNVIFIKASATKELPMPTLEEVRAKKVEDFTAEDKQVLAENVEQLTADEKTQFGFDTAPVVTPVAEDNKNNEGDTNVSDPKVAEVPAELASIAASIKSGDSVVIKASELKELQDMKQDYRLEKAKAVVASHLKRGAIKADQAGAWAERIVADATMEDMLKALPDNQLLASEKGSDNVSELSGNEATVAAAKAKVEASNGSLNIQDAIKQVIAESKAEVK